MLRRVAIVAILLGSFGVAMAHGAPKPVWSGDAIRYWASPPARAAADVAAARWNAARIGIRFRPVASARAADVTIRVDAGRLRRLCGADCLGWATAIGPPASGRATVWLGRGAGAPVTPVAVWVAAHELGHVLGLEHVSGRRCTVMRPQAFAGRCQPSFDSDGPLRCIPAPADVRAAARMYGGRPRDRSQAC